MRANKAETHASAAHTGEGGRNLPRSGAGAEAGAVAVGRTKPEAPGLMEAVVERSNMLCAYERVVKNEGAPGGMGRVKPDSIRQPGTERFLAKLVPKARFALCLARTQLAEPPDADPHVRWCGRGEWATVPPMPIGGKPCGDSRPRLPGRARLDKLRSRKPLFTIPSQHPHPKFRKRREI